MIVKIVTFGGVLAFGAAAPIVNACSTVAPVSNTEMVRTADAIVRAVAVEYLLPPKYPFSLNADNSRTGIPDSKIRFRVVETIRGNSASEVILPGFLVDWDDYNDQPAPYNFVRPSGRHGTCFANSYRIGAEFLLVLKNGKSAEPRVEWYALGPVNEQLHSDDDPWLLWVRDKAKQSGGK